MNPEKSFRQFITPQAYRNAFIVLALLSLPAFAIPPVGIGLAFVAVIYGIVWAVSSNRINKRIAAMKANGTWEGMLQEFSSATLAIDGKIRHSANYIFSRHSGYFFAYNEVLWIYRFTRSYLFIPIASCTMVGDSTGKIRSFCKLKAGNQAGGEEIKAIAAIVQKNNPSVLLGFDVNRQKAYKAKTKR